MDEFFALGAGLEKIDAPSQVPLSRKQADELIFLSALAPVIASNIRVSYAPTIYASDASLRKVPL